MRKRELILLQRLIDLVRYIWIVRLLCLPLFMITRLYKRLLYKRSFDSKFINELKDTHKGERCVIIGNGPSLRIDDLNKINCFSFASNNIIKVFDKTDWRPDVYMCIDKGVLINLMDEIPNIDATYIFLTETAKKYIKSNSKIHYILNYVPFRINYLSQRRCCFSNDPSKYFGHFGTVTGTHIQLAIYMGFSEIVLLGVDHSYSLYLNEKGETLENGVVNYFYNDSDNKYWHIPIMHQMTNGYQMCQEYAQRNGVRIINASRKSELMVFEQGDFDNIIIKSHS